MPSGKRQKKSDAFDGKQSNRQRTHNFEYDKLPAGHIRILQVTHELERNGRRQFSAQLRSFHVEYLPHFVALSYAWAEAGAPRRTLSCNDRHFSISQHVHTALENLCPLDAACSFAIWIDAICIDQDNVLEKNKQLPHMGSIYSLASRVIVWLGPNKRVDQHREKIEFLSDHVESMPDMGRSISWAELKSPPLSEQDDELWIAMGSMISSRWFRRLWIVQELYLAQEVDVLCGRCFLPWNTLKLLCRKVISAQLEWDPSVDFQSLIYCRNEFKNFDLRTVIDLLDGLRGQLVSKPIDKVYGLMFMLPENLREKIEVDYSQESEYWIAYVKLAHVLLTQPGGLSLLNKAPGTNRHLQLPSWCPNWNERSCYCSMPQASDQRIGCGGSLQPLKATDIRIIHNLQHIVVYGFRIDRIVSTIPFDPSVVRWGRRYAREWNFWQQRCLQHLEERMRPDTPHISILSTHLRNLRFGLWNYGNHKIKLMHVNDLPEINRCYEELISSGAVSADPSSIFPADEPEDDYLHLALGSSSILAVTTMISAPTSSQSKEESAEDALETELVTSWSLYTLHLIYTC